MIKKIARTILLLTVILWIGGYSAFLSNMQAVTPQTPSIKTDAIIVLTGGNYRITTGLDLFSKGLAPKLLITGVHNSVTEKEIRTMWKGKAKLPDCCITLGHEATTTYENAIEAQEWITKNNIKSARLVTSIYHIKRATLEFKNKLKDTEIIIHPVEKQDYNMKDFIFWKITFDEYNKTLYRSAMIYLKQQVFK